MRFLLVASLFFSLALVAPAAHAERAVLKLDPPARDDEEARTRIAHALGDDARFVRRSVLGWVVIEANAPPAREWVPVKRAFATAATNDVLLVDGQQWALDMIRIEDAWAISQGSGQRIGVVDTGLLRDHPDIAAHDAGGYDFVDDSEAPAGVGDGTAGRDGDYVDTSPTGDGASLSHGSHVAGIIAAQTNNGAGIAGLNWNATIVSARAVSGATGGLSFDIMEAALWLAGGEVAGVPPIDAPVDVINMSVGFGGGCDAFAQDIIDDIVARGITVVAAVGNHGALFGLTDTEVLAPASCTGVIAVGAVDRDGALTDYTNSDGIIDVVAPGGAEGNPIVSLGTGDAYVGQIGTSMATPHVAGVVSLMRAVNPALSPLEIEAMLRGLTTSCTGCGGVPLLDAAAALQAAQAGEAEAAGGCASVPTLPLTLTLLLVLGARAMRRRT
jgi:serine protease